MVTLSIREQALRAVVAALSVKASPAASVSRSKLDQVKSLDLPCYDITPGEEQITDSGEDGDRHSVTRTLPIVVRAIIDAGMQAGRPVSPDDSALDPFYVFAVKTLTGGTANLGGLVINVEEVSNALVFRPAGHDHIGLEMHFQLTFATKRGDPTQKG